MKNAQRSTFNVQLSSNETPNTSALSVKRSALSVLLIACAVSLSGCINPPPLPKDALVRGVTTKVSTPWGSAEQVITEAATGSAAVKAAGLK